MEDTIIYFFGNSTEWGISHNNVRFLAVERQQSILSRHLTVAKPAEIGEAGVINIVNLNYRGIDCNSQRAVAGARLKHTVNLLAPGLHKLSHDVTERRRCRVLLLYQSLTVTSVEARLCVIIAHNLVVSGLLLH